MVKHVERLQRVLLQAVVEVRLHHRFDGHASGGRSVVSCTTNDANQLPAAGLAVVAEYGAGRDAVNGFQYGFHELSVDVCQHLRRNNVMVRSLRGKCEKCWSGFEDASAAEAERVRALTEAGSDATDRSKVGSMGEGE
eukprot:2143916-Pleurochrysis_carterae.AAC.2